MWVFSPLQLSFFLAALCSLRGKKGMAPHSSTLAWKIPWTEEPGGLQSIGSLRVGHDWATSLSLFTFMHCRKNWQPTPVLLPGESQGRGSLVGRCLCGRTESDTTEATYQQQQQCSVRDLSKDWTQSPTAKQWKGKSCHDIPLLSTSQWLFSFTRSYRCGPDGF